MTINCESSTIPQEKARRSHNTDLISSLNLNHCSLLIRGAGHKGSASLGTHGDGGDAVLHSSEGEVAIHSLGLKQVDRGGMVIQEAYGHTVWRAVTHHLRNLWRANSTNALGRLGQVAQVQSHLTCRQIYIDNLIDNKSLIYLQVWPENFWFSSWSKLAHP